jgi:hypothetical protein
MDQETGTIVDDCLLVTSELLVHRHQQPTAPRMEGLLEATKTNVLRIAHQPYVQNLERYLGETGETTRSVAANHCLDPRLDPRLQERGEERGTVELWRTGTAGGMNRTVVLLEGRVTGLTLVDEMEALAKASLIELVVMKGEAWKADGPVVRIKLREEVLGLTSEVALLRQRVEMIVVVQWMSEARSALEQIRGQPVQGTTTRGETVDLRQQDVVEPPRHEVLLLCVHLQDLGGAGDRSIKG